MKWMSDSGAVVVQKEQALLRSSAAEQASVHHVHAEGFVAVRYKPFKPATPAVSSSLYVPDAAPPLPNSGGNRRYKSRPNSNATILFRSAIPPPPGRANIQKVFRAQSAPVTPGGSNLSAARRVHVHLQPADVSCDAEHHHPMIPCVQSKQF